MRIAVIGAGQMGGGIAFTVASVAKLPVTLIDTSRQSLDRQHALFNRLLDNSIQKGRQTEGDKKEVMGRIQLSEDLSVAYSADYIMEAVPERESTKQELLHILSSNVKKDIVVSTNTSSIPITRLSTYYRKDPSRIIGMHFMNPVPLMRLIEVIRGLQTSDDTYSKCIEMSKLLGKETADAMDTPGFTANRLLMPYINEAVSLLWESGWTPNSNNNASMREHIDATMKLGTNMPMGPLQLADLIGLDTCQSILRVLQEGLGAERYRPCPLLVQMVDAGWLGRKTKRGFYKYD